ncbi:hypothetical protein EJ02DRAFT_499462 [Clathrospora elynae]|uniref:Uncharacterized protein n=1 Tax=Clathrospora elynae TaxID=706981 RepID=A0A6A5T6K6_9PLEO|nr:hypothetical protein EJ02DRAFT_499462 [Clathrospora elynae]
MARLSGLPSEHHHEGPGDAPRRKRGRPGKTQMLAEDVAAASKRTASPSAELSQTKRTKRVQHADDAGDEDQIAEEIQQSFSRSQQGDTIHVEKQSSTTTTRRHNRRQSEPLLAANNDDGELIAHRPAATQPLPGLTPHLDRVGASRTRFTNTRRSRMSMPAQLQVERVDEVDDTGSEGTQVQFVPLAAVLDNRVRRRLRRSHLSQEVNDLEDHQKQDKKMFLELRRQLRAQDDKIKDLEYRLEARRLGDIDITDAHAEELQEELEEARNQIDELRASSMYNGDEHDIADVSEDEEDGLLLDLDMEATPNGKYASRVLELSSQMTLESLPRISQLNRDSLVEGEDAVVLDKIEDQAYSRALGESQGALRAGASTSDILNELRHGFDNLRAEIEKFFPTTTDGLTNQQLLTKLKEKLTLVQTHQKTEVLLRRQYEGVLDLLGDSEERGNEEKQRTILDLEERNAALTTQANNQEAQLKENDETSIGHLGEALDQYRKDLHNVTVAAKAFETEHHELIARMEQEHAAVEGREAALADLEVSIERMEADVDTITTDMTTLSQRLATQTLAREAAESERDEQIQLTVIELNERLADYRANLATERIQREKTEAALDEANDKIEDLNTRLHDTGLQANELRSKLFQLQQEKEREKELNDQLAAETQIRETRENTIVQLEKQILNLTDMTEARNELEQDRDTQVASLASQLTDLRNNLQANIRDLNNQEVAEKDRVYLENTTVLQEKIQDLEEDLTTQKAENEGYRKENTSLSERVEAEANELLNIMGSHNDQITSLQSSLQEASAERTNEYEETLLERTQEITDMRLLGDARAETIERFRKAEEDTRITIDTLTLSQRTLQEQNERLADNLKRRNQEALQAISEMKLKRVEIKTQGVDLHRVVAGKVTKTSEKVKVGKKGSKKKVTKRQWDSGFGVDDNIEDEELEEPLAA